MNNLGNEVTVKMKDAIRAKLKEMNANSSDEIIDYIMLLVTTKKSTSDLTKSIDFLMENNTNVFVKWLSTIIKKLQQVTVSTEEKKISENLQISKDEITVIKQENTEFIISEADDVIMDDCNKEKNEVKLNLNGDTQIFNGEREDYCLSKSNVYKLPQCTNNKLSSLVGKSVQTKQNNCFSSTEMDTAENNLQKKNTLIKTVIRVKNSDNVLTNKMIDGDEKMNCKSKRPRITINSDDEDEKNTKIVPVTIKDTTKQITNMLLKKENKVSRSQVIVVKPIASNKGIHETKKNMLMRDLIVQRVDNQRGALALDTAFKYVQQQIGASDNEIAVIKKWRDYAVEMLRSKKKV